MNIERLSVMVAVGEASPIERGMHRIGVALHPSLRARDAEYRQVTAMLAAALGDGDDLVTIRVSRRPLVRRPKAAVVILVLLVVGAVIEWGAYSLPRLGELTSDFAHACGLK